MDVEPAQWRLFLAAADEGSLGRQRSASAPISPQLSRALRRLELTVETSLFIRSPTGTTLTAAAARYSSGPGSQVAAADTLDDAEKVLVRR